MNIEAYILVGGRSSRLGRDKALERLGGRTLAERALHTIRAALPGIKISFVAGGEVGFAIEAARLDTSFIFDLVEGRGPLGGLHSALANASAEWVLILACDLPFVGADVIARLAQFTDVPGSRFTVILPEQPDGRLQPLCAFYKVAAVKPVIEEIIRRPRPSPPMHEVVRELTPRIVKPVEYSSETGSPGENFENVNTEEDLALARTIVRRTRDQ